MPATDTTAPAIPGGDVLSPWQRLRRNPVAMFALLILAAVVLTAFIGPNFIAKAKREPSSSQFTPPGESYLLGHDLNGRDLAYRVMTGAQVSLIVGLAGAALSVFIGTAYGMVAGYAGGKVDELMMRLVDIFYAIPRLIIVMLLINIFDKGVKLWLTAHKDTLADSLPWVDIGFLTSSSKTVILIIALGLLEWLGLARIVRGQVLALKNQQFVTAARALGQSHFRILTRHLLPNLAGIIITYLTLIIPSVILDESFLSFLGLGIEEPLASWGCLLNDGRAVINPVKSFWWLLAFPAAAMSITLMALNFLGDGLRDAFDPRPPK